MLEEDGEAEEEDEAPDAVDMEACVFVWRAWVCDLMGHTATTVERWGVVRPRRDGERKQIRASAAWKLLYKKKRSQGCLGTNVQ